MTIQRREPRPNDVELEILFCGVCHSDIHQARDEWSGATYPMVPRHEIVGRVTARGGEVTNFQLGDIAGVGCIVDSCRACAPCGDHLEQFCEKGPALEISVSAHFRVRRLCRILRSRAEKRR